MKQFLFFLLFAAALFRLVAVEPVDYSDPANWALREARPTRAVDLFYVYPTLTSDKNKPLMDWSDPAVRRKAVDFATAQTSGFREFCNLYAPFVRQLEIGRCLPLLNAGRADDTDPLLQVGIRDTADAFLHYLKTDNGNRPFLLLGHSQGASDLWFLLLRHPEITGDKRFIAAYLPGIAIPRDTTLPLAKKADDTGVIVSWNTQSPTTGKTIFNTPGGYCINPLNWRTDATPAGPAENLEAVFYQFKTGKTDRIPRFCGATVDPAVGTLTVTPPPGRWDQGFGNGVYHVNDLWFFYGNLVANARLRAGIK